MLNRKSARKTDVDPSKSEIERVEASRDATAGPESTETDRTISDEHYGNMVTYLRLKGLVPPSSAPRK